MVTEVLIRRQCESLILLVLPYYIIHCYASYELLTVLDFLSKTLESVQLRIEALKEQKQTMLLQMSKRDTKNHIMNQSLESQSGQGLGTIEIELQRITKCIEKAKSEIRAHQRAKDLANDNNKSSIDGC